MNVCNFCENSFSSTSGLLNHQKTAKYCLQNRGKKINSFKCDGCDKKFTQKSNLQRHEINCADKKIIIALTEKDKIILKLETQLKEKDEHIKELETKLENIAIKAVSRPFTVNNQQNNKIQQINNFLPITDKHLQDHVGNLTLEHIKEGASGYAKYALEYPLKDRITCSDFARRKIKYKNEDGQVVTDPEMITLSKKLFSAIKDRNSDLINKYSKELQEKFWGIPNEAKDDLEEKEVEELDIRMDKVREVIFSIMSQNRQVRELADGGRSELYYDFLRHVCSGCV